jgi:ubiquitin-activating enzyme E1
MYKCQRSANSIFRMSALVEQISKKPIPEHQKNVIFEITAEDETEEDVEIPYVMLKLQK